MIGCLLALTLAAPFPLPMIDGKPLAVSEGQKTFRLPMRFEKVKRFYVDQLGSSAELKEASPDGKRVLTLAPRGKSEAWRKAIIREGEVETVVEVTPVLRLEEETISGNARPLVEFIIGRSPEVQKAVTGIDHADGMRAK